LSAGADFAGVCIEIVAQSCTLLYRRFLICCAWDRQRDWNVCRMQFGDTADYKSFVSGMKETEFIQM
jgi:hypothetical protein